MSVQAGPSKAALAQSLNSIRSGKGGITYTAAPGTRVKSSVHGPSIGTLEAVTRRAATSTHTRGSSSLDIEFDMPIVELPSEFRANAPVQNKEDDNRSVYCEGARFQIEKSYTTARHGDNIVNGICYSSECGSSTSTRRL